jgi:hypothetical protein
MLQRASELDEQDPEESIWTEEIRSDRRLEKTVYQGVS